MRVDYHKATIGSDGEFAQGEILFSGNVVSFVAVQHVIMAIVLKEDNTFQEVAIKQLRVSVEKEEHARRMEHTAGEYVINDVRGNGSVSAAVSPSKTEGGGSITSQERTGSGKAGSGRQGSSSPKGKR